MAVDANERATRSAPGTVTVTFAVPNSARIALHGEWDISTEPKLATALERASRARQNIVIDLSTCSFLDVRTIGRLIAFAQALTERGGRLAVALPPSQTAVNRAFSLLAIRELLPVHDSLEDAQRDVTRSELSLGKAWLEPSPPMSVD